MTLCRRRTALGFCLLVLAVPVSAHEFWIEPLNYRVPAGGQLRAHLKVGQHFKGDTYAYIPGNALSFGVELAGDLQPADSRAGDLPALDQPAPAEGLAVIHYESNYSRLTYDSVEKFAAFADAEGVGWAVDAHYRRMLPRSDIVETYRRYAKSLIGVGHAEGADGALGMAFEWVLEDNPYTDVAATGATISARLLWRRQPFPDAQVRVFNRRGDRVRESVLHTDAEGRVAVDVSSGGEFLLNSVHLIEPPPETARITRAVWESLWASVTFEVRR